MKKKLCFFPIAIIYNSKYAHYAQTFQNFTLTFNADIPEICVKSTSAEKTALFVLWELGRERMEESWEACCSGN